MQTNSEEIHATKTNDVIADTGPTETFLEVCRCSSAISNSAISRACDIAEEVKLHLNEFGNAVSIGDTASARDHAIHAFHAGGPETTGVWGACKVGIGLAALATGHVLLGGVACIWGATAIVGANCWRNNRDFILEWLTKDVEPNPPEVVEPSEVEENERIVEEHVSLVDNNVIHSLE